MTIPPPTFGPALRALRRHQLMKAATLARRAKLSRSAVSNIESGRKQPSLAAAARLAGVLGVTVDELATERTADASH